MTMDEHTRRLVAVAAAVGANAYSCLQHYVAKAREKGVADDETAEAIEEAKRVREGTQRKLDGLAADLLATENIEAATTCCGG